MVRQRTYRLGYPNNHLLELVYIDSFTVYELQQLVGLRSAIFIPFLCLLCLLCSSRVTQSEFRNND